MTDDIVERLQKWRDGVVRAGGASAPYAIILADAIDELARLRAAPVEADLVPIIARRLAKRQNGEHYEGYESSHREAAEDIAAALDERERAAFEAGAEAMRAAAKKACSDSIPSEFNRLSPAWANACGVCFKAIEALPLPKVPHGA